MIGNAASIKEQDSKLAEAANKDAKIEALEKRVRNVIVQRPTRSHKIKVMDVFKVTAMVTEKAAEAFFRRGQSPTMQLL